MTSCTEELSELAGSLIFDYTGEISIEQHEEDETDDEYLQVTAGDTVNLSNILKNVQNKVVNYAEESEYTYLTKTNNNQLFIKIVDKEIADEDTDWIVA